MSNLLVRTANLHYSEFPELPPQEVGITNILNSDLIKFTFAFLNGLDLGHAAQVCRRWHYCSNLNEAYTKGQVKIRMKVLTALFGDPAILLEWRNENSKKLISESNYKDQDYQFLQKCIFKWLCNWHCYDFFFHHYLKVSIKDQFEERGFIECFKPVLRRMIDNSQEGFPRVSEIHLNYCGPLMISYLKLVIDEAAISKLIIHVYENTPEEVLKNLLTILSKSCYIQTLEIVLNNFSLDLFNKTMLYIKKINEAMPHLTQMIFGESVIDKKYLNEFLKES